MEDGCLARCVAHDDGSMHQLDDRLVIHVLRNPAGWSEDAVRACRLFAAEIVEQQFRAINTSSVHT